MTKSNRASPIIVIGMHRSGTTMVVRALEKLGVFMGSDQEHNSESKFFIKLNEWVMRQASSSWDRPLPLEFVRKDECVKGLINKYLKFYLRSPRKLAYQGLKIVSRENSSWGWKDPRNTFTIPFWLDIYPDAKILIVERNGLDVSTSLVKRRAKYLVTASDRFEWIKYFHFFRFNRYPFGSSSLLQTVDDGIDLWYQYLLEGRKVSKLYPTQSYLVKYENLLANPEAEVRKIQSFLDLSVLVNEDMALKHIIQDFDPTRANSSKVKESELSKDSLDKLSRY